MPTPLYIDNPSMWIILPHFYPYPALPWFFRRVGREGSHYDVAEMAIVYSKKKMLFYKSNFLIIFSFQKIPIPFLHSFWTPSSLFTFCFLLAVFIGCFYFILLFCIPRYLAHLREVFSLFLIKRRELNYGQIIYFQSYW